MHFVLFAKMFYDSTIFVAPIGTVYTFIRFLSNVISNMAPHTISVVWMIVTFVAYVIVNFILSDNSSTFSAMFDKVFCVCMYDWRTMNAIYKGKLRQRVMLCRGRAEKKFMLISQIYLCNIIFIRTISHYDIGNLRKTYIHAYHILCSILNFEAYLIM